MLWAVHACLPNFALHCTGNAWPHAAGVVGTLDGSSEWAVKTASCQNSRPRHHATFNCAFKDRLFVVLRFHWWGIARCPLPSISAHNLKQMQLHKPVQTGHYGTGKNSAARPPLQKCRRMPIASAVALAAVAQTDAAPLQLLDQQSHAAHHGDPHPGLRLFLDSADVQQWRRFAPTGALWGVTTNPAILEKDKVPCTLQAAAELAKEVRIMLQACIRWWWAHNKIAMCARCIVSLRWVQCLGKACMLGCSRLHRRIASSVFSSSVAIFVMQMQVAIWWVAANRCHTQMAPLHTFGWGGPASSRSIKTVTASEDARPN